MFKFLRRHRCHPKPSPGAKPNAAFIWKVVVVNRYYLHGNTEFLIVKAQLNWTDPSVYTDGTPLTVANVEVFDDIGDGNGPQLLGNVGPGVGAFLTGDLAVGSHSFTVVVQDGSTPQRSSAPSNVAVVTVAPANPNPAAVTNLTATLVP